MSPTEGKNLAQIEAYYAATHDSYQRWGSDSTRQKLYSLHFGLETHQGEDTPFDNKAALVALTDTLIDFAQIQNGSKILDAGCGTGTVSYRIQDRFNNCFVYGINISTTQLREAVVYNNKNTSSPYFARADYHHTSFRDGFFDQVLFCESLIHSPYKIDLLGESTRIIRQGGSLVVSDYFRLKEPSTELDVQQWEVLERGWELPYFMTMPDFIIEMSNKGLRSITFKNLTKQVERSVVTLGNSCEAKLKLTDNIPPEIRNNRLASVAFRDLLLSGNLGYFFIKGNVK
jgi:ubiquinone/menaquinone biosynthesis C-methylase UbiE